MTVRTFFTEFVASMVAFITGWEIGFIVGKLTGAIDGIEWKAVLLYTPLMSFFYGIPVCLAAAFLLGLFAFFYIKYSAGQENI
jgi:hypothetical protein